MSPSYGKSALPRLSPSASDTLKLLIAASRAHCLTCSRVNALSEVLVMVVRPRISALKVICSADESVLNTSSDIVFCSLRFCVCLQFSYNIIQSLSTLMDN